jgi:hypothetical protein
VSSTGASVPAAPNAPTGPAPPPFYRHTDLAQSNLYRHADSGLNIEQSSSSLNSLNEAIVYNNGLNYSMEQMDPGGWNYYPQEQRGYYAESLDLGGGGGFYPQDPLGHGGVSYNLQSGLEQGIVEGNPVIDLNAGFTPTPHVYPNTYQDMPIRPEVRATTQPEDEMSVPTRFSLSSLPMRSANRPVLSTDFAVSPGPGANIAEVSLQHDMKLSVMIQPALKIPSQPGMLTSGADGLLVESLVKFQEDNPQSSFNNFKLFVEYQEQNPQTSFENFNLTQAANDPSGLLGTSQSLNPETFTIDSNVGINASFAFQICDLFEVYSFL